MKGSLLLYNLKLNCLIFFYQSKQLTDYIYTNICCKLSKCIGQTPCSYEHYLVFYNVTCAARMQKNRGNAVAGIVLSRSKPDRNLTYTAYTTIINIPGRTFDGDCHSIIQLMMV